MTDYSIARLEQAVAAITAYIEAEMGRSARSVLGRTSGFWRDEFAARPNYPSVSDFMAFRREGFTLGMADSFSYDPAAARQANIKKERDHAGRTCEIFRQSADPFRIITLDEPTLGAPFVFESHGVHRSASFWTNATTALHVRDTLERLGLTGRALNILEIGAGWGCVAHQLHQLLDVRSYAIVDLAENLALSAAYVSSTLDLELQFATGAPASVLARPNALICALPGMVSVIGQKYEAVVNTFSLQEMELDTVQGYFAWIAQVLSEDGVFLSFNSHGKSGVKVPSDYPLEEFHLDRLAMFRAYPSGLLNTIPYEMILSRRRGRAAVDPQLLNTLCCLIQFGLGDDLKPLCDAFIRHALPPEIDRALREFSGFFSLSAQRRAEALGGAAAAVLPAIHAYLRGMDAFARKDKAAAQAAFASALDGGLQGFARLRASAHLAILTGQKTLPKWQTDFDAYMAYPELAQMLADSNAGPFTVQFERIVSVELPALETANNGA